MMIRQSHVCSKKTTANGMFNAPAKRSNVFVSHHVRHTKRLVAERANNV